MKVDEARSILSDLGFDDEQSNSRSALVLLALLHVRMGDSWKDATNPLMGTRAIMDWIRDEYHLRYAANTRETIRRFSLHQFCEGMLVEMNPDEPDRPVNSPKSCYAVTDEALNLIRQYGGTAWNDLLRVYLSKRPGLKAAYEAERSMRRIPVSLPGGAHVNLSPGGQNVLIQSMIKDFCALFTPGGTVVYVGDADSKWAHFDASLLAKLGVKVDQHGKMPDLIVYMQDKNWLVLLEAASSHGPVDAKRHAELEQLFRSSSAGLVYVSCFPDRSEMRKYLTKIAWETEVWCADNPTHLIHFNGERFLGPYR